MAPKKKVKVRSRTWQEKLGMGLGLFLLAAATYFALFDPWDGRFDPPQTVDVAMFRIGHGFKSFAGGVQGEIRETNESMQNTVDGRNDLNDSRIDRDKGGE